MANSSGKFQCTLGVFRHHNGLLAVRFSLEVCVVVTRIEKLGRGGIAPIFARARGFEHSTDLKRKGGLQAVLLAEGFHATHLFWCTRNCYAWLTSRTRNIRVMF